MKKKVLRLKQGKIFAFKGEVPRNTKDGGQGRKRIIETFLQENYANPRLSAGMLAKHMNLSVRHLNRIAIEFYGVTFYQFLTGIRLESAKELLLKKDMTVKEVALKVGYESPTGFFVAFKKRYGMTPGEYREKAKK